MTRIADLDPVADSELCRLLLKGLHAPLGSDDQTSLNQQIAATPDGAARAASFIEQWMIAGVVDPAGLARSAFEDVEVNGAVVAEETHPPKGYTRRWLIAASLAALCLLPAGYILSRQDGVQMVEASSDKAIHHRLADGSDVILSRGGRMEVRMDDHARTVRLLEGEAFYHVAKDAARPFTVSTGTHRLTALGTQFNVDPQNQALRVDLLEGRLRIESATKETAPIVLAAGERYEEGRTPHVMSADPEAASWGEGRLVFDDIPLREVARRLARHSDTHLYFTSAQAGALHFSGVLRIDAPGDWKPALETVLPVSVTPTPAGYSLSYRPG